MDLGYISTLLLSALDPERRAHSEESLLKLESGPDFGYALLSLAEDNTKPELQLPAMLYLKNYLKRALLHSDTGAGPVLEKKYKDMMLMHMIEIVTNINPNIQKHMGEAISLILGKSNHDELDYFLPVLISKIGVLAGVIEISVLRIMHSIFKKYRYELRSDVLFTEINIVLKHFEKILLDMYKMVDNKIDKGGNTQQLAEMTETFILLNKIFYSLSYQDIPAYFENNIDEFMSIIQKYLSYPNNLTVVGEQDSSLIARLYTSISKIGYLYSSKYQNESKVAVPFVRSILRLVTLCPQDEKYDKFISCALKVTSINVRNEDLHGIFQDTANLDVICNDIIMNNMQMRSYEQEMFKDEPLDFVRKDIDGAEVESRRKAAEELTKSLIQVHGKCVFSEFLKKVSQGIEMYNASTSPDRWIIKDIIVNLYTAIVTMTSTQTKGATLLHKDANIQEFFENCIGSCLKEPQNHHPILVVDALKYVMFFRHYFTKEQVVAIFGLAVNLMEGGDVAVSTYAAILLDRLVFTMAGEDFVIDSCEILKYFERIIRGVFVILKTKCDNRTVENEFVMKAFLRIIVRLKTEIGVHANSCLKEAHQILLELYNNGYASSKFYHFLFETICYLIVYNFPCFSVDAQLSVIMIFTPGIHAILQDSTHEFVPYVFMLVSAFVEYYSGPDLVPAPLKFVFEPILQASLWLNPANISSLVRLLEVFMVKDPRMAAETEILISILGIAQNLIENRQFDHHGFDIYEVVFLTVPLDRLEEYIVPILAGILRVYYNTKSSKCRSLVLTFTCYIVLCLKLKNELSIEFLIQKLDSMRADLFRGVFSSLFGIGDQDSNFRGGQSIRPLNPKDKKIVLHSLSKIVSSKTMLENFGDIWIGSICMFIEIFEDEGISKVHMKDEIYEGLEEERMVLSSNLNALPNNFRYGLLDNLGDPARNFVESLYSVILSEGQASFILRKSDILPKIQALFQKYDRKLLI